MSSGLPARFTLYDFFSMLPRSFTVTASWLEGSMTWPVGSLLMHLAFHEARSGRRVCWAASNLKVMDVARLCVAQEADVSLQRMARGILDAPQRKRLAKATKSINNTKILLWDVQDVVPAAFERKVRGRHAHGMDLLVVDSLERLGKGWGKEPARRLAEIALRCGIPVVAGMEIRPTGSSGCFWSMPAPALRDLPRDVLQHADQVIVLYPKALPRLPQGKQTLVLQGLQDPMGLDPLLEIEHQRATGRISM